MLRVAQRAFLALSLEQKPVVHESLLQRLTSSGLRTQAVDRADALSALCDPETRIMAEANDAIIAQLREQLAAKDVELEQAQAQPLHCAVFVIASRL